MGGEKKGKRRGLGGLTPEKKKLLKQLILQKAAEDLKKKQEREAEEKRKIIEARVPKITIDGLGEDQLRGKVKELYDIVCRLEEEKYDWEIRISKQEFELNELNIKVNDIKGKFIKPVLKKVAKTEQRMAKVDKAAVKTQKGFRENLKSTGQSKFTIEEEEKAKPEWAQEKLKSKEGGEHGSHAEKAPEEAEAEAEEEEEEEEEEEDDEEEEEEEE